ncbi:unnamed protein product [Rhizoctonia solani]|uniref:Uncharacterized protein n=1 Tax=Rhizoctonia solani TaxID=456999 RepID=A0A8H3CZX3_9AGAM|nr:unnamed protein product [Rhizoctonia solani]
MLKRTLYGHPGVESPPSPPPEPSEPAPQDGANRQTSNGNPRFTESSPSRADLLDVSKQVNYADWPRAI